MATQIEPTRKQLYEEDFYVWSQRQAELLRTRRYDELDLEHLIEEVEDLGGALKRVGPEPGSHDHRAPAQAPTLASGRPAPGWRDTVRAQRNDLLMTSPDPAQDWMRSCGTLRPCTPAGVGSLRDHGEDAAADALPQSCPYTADQITGDWLP